MKIWLIRIGVPKPFSLEGPKLIDFFFFFFTIPCAFSDLAPSFYGASVIFLQARDRTADKK